MVCLLSSVLVDACEKQASDDCEQQRHSQQNAPFQIDVLSGIDILRIHHVFSGCLTDHIPDLGDADVFVDHPDLRNGGQFIDCRIQRNGRQGVEVAYRTDGPDTPAADRQVGNLVHDALQGERDAGEDQLNNKQEGDNRHCGCGGFYNTGDHQGHHICGIGDDKQRNAEINIEVSGYRTGCREREPVGYQEVIYHKLDQRLSKAQHHLIDHMGNDVG